MGVASDSIEQEERLSGKGKLNKPKGDQEARLLGKEENNHLISVFYDN